MMGGSDYDDQTYVYETHKSLRENAPSYYYPMLRMDMTIWIIFNAQTSKGFFCISIFGCEDLLTPPLCN